MTRKRDAGVSSCAGTNAPLEVTDVTDEEINPLWSSSPVRGAVGLSGSPDKSPHKPKTSYNTFILKV